MPHHDSDAHAARETRRGLTYGLVAYLLWGLFPIYLKALGHVPPGDVLAHRILWSLALLAGVILLAGRGPAVRAALRNRGVMLTLLATSLLIAVNWLVYIYAVASEQMLAGSLGYYLNPLVSVGFGYLILKERLTRTQAGAMALALAGIAVLAIDAGGALWITLTLAFSFSLYGLLRKMAPVDPLTGLALETLILAPVAAAWLLWQAGEEPPSFGQDRTTALLLVLSGAVTAGPLLLFSAAAKRLRYATVGILQFIAPSLVFALALLVYGETLTWAHIVCFGAIWTAVAIYVAENLRLARQVRPEEAAAIA
ncbi:MAG TPA: EamA family transporter RarD [Sphingomonadaceae bacterium]|nr:EamA family transporter RarD [Sphingomonadaceae bacterium]